MHIFFRTTLWMAAFVAAGLLASTAAASPAERAQKQHHRIAAGIEDGSLTRGEAHRLRGEQAKIRRMGYRLHHNDGKLGPRERAKLHRRQDRASVHIYRGRHNQRVR